MISSTPPRPMPDPLYVPYLGCPRVVKPPPSSRITKMMRMMVNTVLLLSVPLLALSARAGSTALYVRPALVGCLALLVSADVSSNEHLYTIYYPTAGGTCNEFFSSDIFLIYFAGTVG